MVAGQRCLFSRPDGWWRWRGHRQGPQEPVTMLHQNIFQRLDSTHPWERPHMVCHLAPSHLSSSGSSSIQKAIGIGAGKSWGWRRSWRIATSYHMQEEPLNGREACNQCNIKERIPDSWWHEQVLIAIQGATWNLHLDMKLGQIFNSVRLTQLVDPCLRAWHV